MASQAGLRRLVIVESPTKASKIASYLGAGYVVESSRGHVRDLPEGSADVPAKYKGQPWARTGVDIDNDFEPLYVVTADKKATIRSLKSALADADELLLATDGDREGEAIAWHLLQELKPRVPARRMVFHEITEQAIQEAVANPRELDIDLVDAQEARRILDRLYGYEVSPVLWRKVKPRLSAGRVQSVATRLVVDRERERIAFRSAGYWDLDAVLDAGSEAEPPTFSARLTQVGEKRVAQGRDFDSRGNLTGKNLVHLDETNARALADALPQASWSVTSVESRPYTRKPYAPFRTTTLQQEAGRKLGFTAQRAMSVAQDLYERGFITYMRTDSVALSSQAITAARNQVQQLFGANYLPAQPRVYASKVKNAQEAHEAIRPSGEVFQTPAQTGLSGDHFRLYELIWMRTIASQMKDAEGQTVTVRIEARGASTGSANGSTGSANGLGSLPEGADSCTFTASGRTITFHGFLKAYVEAIDESREGSTSDDAQSRLPQLSQGQSLAAEEVTANGHETKPPARYTEPSLVAKLEELEIGRPSTYASIIRTITSRDYVFKRGSALVPTWLAFAVTRLLEEHFPKLIDYRFTATMESDLDEVARGDMARLQVLKDFWFGAGDAAGLHALVSELGEIDARKLSTFELGDLDSGIVVRVGRYGTYVEGAEEKRANVPDDLPPDELTVEYAKELLARPMGEERELGTDPDSGNAVVARNGRFGPYVTEVLGEDAPKSAKPRTGSLFRSMDLDTVTLEQALRLMSLPRVVGKDAEGTEITAQNGRYGPYLKKGTDSRSLETEDHIFSITLEQAEAIYAQPKQRGRAAAKPPLKELGNDPVSGRPMVVKDGRFGPYVTDGETNATLRRDDSVEAITPERGAELLAEKRAKGPAKKATRKKATAKKAPARKTAAKKTTAKKAPAKKAATKKAPARKTAAKQSD
ncbi:DNA topoisomerase I [Enemella dayhoffiae]|uniref:DNA topoisomerase 1 n=1 Tax=Enemella dayhoffiae TaxID=2016507 RepID=A0A255HA31_9ACTN|nr:type I DNA topoisomerase [Enemella dayhoffiae]OYO24186.1 DNA topoisomerase I [Enemella dayhoffiae]